MKPADRLPNGKPYDIHERLFEFACDVIAAVEFLHKRGPIARALSYQILKSGTSVGANMEEADGASSARDFVSKTRIALREVKETQFRLRVCSNRGFLDGSFDPLIQESSELVRIIAKIRSTASKRANNAGRRKPRQRPPDVRPGH